MTWSSWSLRGGQCVNFGSFDLYKQRFMETAEFFRPRFEDAVKVGSAMIQAIMEDAREE